MQKGHLATNLSIENHVKLLEEYSKAYYEGNTKISDAEYDALEEELRQLDPTNPWFSKVREASAKFFGQKRPHLYGEIGSIKKIHSLSESKIDGSYTISAKLDGTSMVVYFKNGKVLYAATRGDGQEGFDVTDKYYAIVKKYNVHIPEDFTGAIRGEVVLSNKNWEKFKSIHPEAKMQRNTGTGLMNSKEVTEETELLDWVIYETPATNKLIGFNHEASNLTIIHLGYPIVPYSVFNQKSLISEESLLKLRDLWAEEFPIDGLVFNQIQVWQSLDGLNFPISRKEAYKFDAESKDTTVTGIEWTLHSSGRLTPVVQVDPVELSGATVRRATGFNAAFIKENGIKIGATVSIKRSNEVIPYITSLTEGSNDGEVPTVCPYCGEQLIWSGVHLRCVNADCPELQRLVIRDFLRVCGGKVKGVSDSIYDILQKEDFNETIQAMQAFDYPGITGHQSELIKKVCNNILNGVSAKNLVKTVNPDNIGDKFLNKFFIKENEEWVKDYINGRQTYYPNGISTLNIQALIAVQFELMHIVEILQFHFIPIIFECGETKKAIKDARYYCVTGSLSISRSQFEVLCRTAGWEMTSIKKAEVLVTNDTTTGTAKNLEAQRLGKKIMTEQQFVDEYIK